VPVVQILFKLDGVKQNVLRAVTKTRSTR